MAELEAERQRMESSMKLTAYQRRLVTYVKCNHPCYPKRKTKGMSKQELAELEKQADGNAIAWLDSRVRQWRENSPQDQQDLCRPVTDEDDEHEPN